MEERPQQAARPPEAAAASAPPRPGPPRPSERPARRNPRMLVRLKHPRNRRATPLRGPQPPPSPSRPSGAATDQPDAIKSEAEETPSEPEREEAEAVAEPQPAASPGAPAEAPAPAEPGEEPQAVYDRVLQEQRDKGSSPQVAEARAKVARVKAERGVRASIAPAHAAEPVPSVPQQTRSGRARTVGRSRGDRARAGGGPRRSDRDGGTRPRGRKRHPPRPSPPRPRRVARTRRPPTNACWPRRRRRARPTRSRRVVRRRRGSVPRRAPGGRADDRDVAAGRDLGDRGRHDPDGGARRSRLRTWCTPRSYLVGHPSREPRRST